MLLSLQYKINAKNTNGLLVFFDFPETGLQIYIMIDPSVRKTLVNFKYKTHESEEQKI